MSKIRSAILLRVRIVFLLFLIVSGLIVVRIINIQYVNGEHWKALADKRGVRERPLKSTRGNVYSDNGSLLATSIPQYTLAFDPSISRRNAETQKIFKAGLDSLCNNLAEFFGDKTASAYKQKILNARSQGRKYLSLNRKKINFHDKQIMDSWPLFRDGTMNGGVIFEKVEKRYYPFDEDDLAKRTIGYSEERIIDSVIHKYGAGLEYSFDSILSGRDGKAWFTKVSGGAWKMVHNSDEVKPIHGLDIETTLDINLQDVAERALKRKLVETEASYGTVLVMEVKTGEVKAIANLSRVKSGKFEGAYIEDFNYGVGVKTNPGSTFKLASLMAYLEENPQVDINKDSIDCGDGFFQIKDAVMTDAHMGGFGKLSIKEVFENSSNIGVAKLMLQTFSKDQSSLQRYIDYLTLRFGLADPLNFQIKNDAAPFVKTPDMDSWSGITLPWMSIGYEVEMTPLQILAFYNGVANGGKMIQPIIVKRLRRSNVVVEEFKAEVIQESLCSKETLDKLHSMLLGVVQKGTANNIRSNEYSIAGKTGTCQKLKESIYVKEYYASFVGYFPASNPKYSMIVCIDEPQVGGKYGNQVAAPVFKEIADIIYSRDLDLHVPFVEKAPEKGVYPVIKGGYYEELKMICDKFSIPNLESNTHSEWVTTGLDSKNERVFWKDNVLKTGLTPDVKGLTLKDALFILENAGYKVVFEGVGRVESQSIPAGKKILGGSKIKLILS